MEPQPVVSRLKVAQVAPSTQSTMTHISSYAGSGPLRGLYEPLIGVDVDTGGYAPDRLATEWSLSSDGMDWTFKLREGVPFHNGVEFTAKDIVRTWEVYSAASSATTGASFFRNWLGDDKENFEITNDHEIIWHLVKPEGGLRPWLSDLLMFLIISDDYWQEQGEEGYLDDPVGTGPFQFVELVFNSHILHERVDNHWRKTPEVAELQFFYVPEPANRQAMLLAKEAHIADLPRVLFAPAREQGLEIVHSTQAGSYILITYGGQYYDTPEGLEDIFDPTEPQLKLDVRRAMSLAINRQQINDVFFEGVLEPQTIHALHPREDPWIEGRWPPDEYDPEEAKRLLAGAGYPDGFDITLVVSPTSSVPELTDIAETITNYWNEVGLNANLEVVESSYTLARERKLAGKAALGNTGLVSYELQMPLNLKLQKGQSHYHDKKELDALARKLETTIDPDARITAAREIADYLYANYVTLPLFFVTTAVVINPAVVEEYRAIILNIGPGFRHEYTKIVKN
jgi:ABC-type transport system substrate-binding protein